jgi:hypothetical protein
MTAAALKGPADVVTIPKDAAALTTELRTTTDATSERRERRQPINLRKQELERAAHLIQRASQELHTNARLTKRTTLLRAGLVRR